VRRFSVRLEIGDLGWRMGTVGVSRMPTSSKTLRIE